MKRAAPNSDGDDAADLNGEREGYVPNTKVLFVDDEENILRVFTSIMRKEPFQIFTLNDSRQIQEYCAQNGPFAVVLSDQRMPEVDGVKVLEHVASLWPETIRVIITGYSDPKDTVRAINIAGIRHFINKPWNDVELKKLLADWTARYNLQMENSFLVDELKQKNKSLHELLNGTVSQTARILSDMVGYVNPEGASQVDRIRRVGNPLLATMQEVSQKERWEIQRAIDLYNLGLLLLPAGVQVTLNKEGLRSLERLSSSRNHHLLAAELLKDIPQFGEVSRIIRFLHKDYSGNGIPHDDTTRGEELPLGSRLIRILVDLDRLNTEKVNGRKLLEKMCERTDTYDVSLIGRILKGVTPGVVPTIEREVAIEEMAPGMVLIEDLLSNRGELLLRANTTLTKTSITILLQWHANDPVRQLFKVRGDSETDG